jgi:diacylglycerol kinase family enzyme
MADAGGPGTLCAAFQATVARYPDQMALRTPGGAMTLTWGRSMPVGADGESIDIPVPLAIRMVPNALRIIAPR